MILILKVLQGVRINRTNLRTDDSNVRKEN